MRLPKFWRDSAAWNDTVVSAAIVISLATWVGIGWWLELPWLLPAALFLGPTSGFLFGVCLVAILCKFFAA